jgi:hypothetical protein
MIFRSLLSLLLLVPTAVAAQTDTILARQVAQAVAPLPQAFRAGATVLGYSRRADLPITLRAGEGPFICLADDPSDTRFHVACYHRDLEPFMARGRELRAQGHTQDVDSIRFREIGEQRLAMPRHPAALYSLTGPADSVRVADGAVTGAQPLYVVYIPFATPESTGLPAQPAPNAPWIMFPGTPKAHIMFVPRM